MKQLNFKDPGMLTPKEFYELVLMPLSRVFCKISQRGIHVDTAKLSALRTDVDRELRSECSQISAILQGKTVIAQAPPKAKPDPATLNLSSPQQVMDVLRTLGMKIPKKRRADGTYTESCDEESLNELSASNPHPFLKKLLRIRELNKLNSSYIETELESDTLFGAYFTTGTVSGRRSCRQNYLGLGTNLQNQPKHTDLAARYRECLIARQDYIFVKCDQVSAEDWIVQGLIADIGADASGLNELRSGADRHAALAAFIFGKPIDMCGKDTAERFMGKKVRHAGNYDMGAFRFAQEMAAEGHQVTEAICEWMLERFHLASPGIKHIYHPYIQYELMHNRQLTNPFGFCRQFFGLRDYGDNRKLFKEAYAQLPQGTVGINTGIAILWLEANHPGHVLLDDHDAVTLEVPDSLSSVCDAVSWLQTAFDRDIRFPRGLTITIPIEFEIGHDLGHMRTVKAHADQQKIRAVYESLDNGQSKNRMLAMDRSKDPRLRNNEVSRENTKSITCDSTSATGSAT